MVFFLTIYILQDLLLLIGKPHNNTIINVKKYLLGFKSVLYTVEAHSSLPKISEQKE